MSIQEQAASLRMLPNWLGSTDVALQFFAAQTLYVQCQTNGLEQDEEEEFIAWCFDFTWTLAPSLPPLVRGKWCQAMALLAIRQAIRGAQDGFFFEGQGVVPPGIQVAILAVIPEELGVLGSAMLGGEGGPTLALKVPTDQLYKARHYFKEKRPLVSALLEKYASNQEITGPWFACLRTWMAWGLTWQDGSMPQSLARLAQTLQGGPDGVGWNEAIAVLVDLAEASGEAVAAPLLDLILATVQAVSSRLPGPLIAAMVAFVENHYDWIYRYFDSEAVQRLLEHLLKLSARQADSEEEGEEDENASLTAVWAWWPQLQEVIGQEGAQQEARFQTFFIRLLQACLQGAMRTKTTQQRRELSEAVLACWRILQVALLQTLVSILRSTQDARVAEACLWAATQAAEEFDPADEQVGDTPFILEELLQAGTMWGLNDSLMALVGASAHALNAQTLSALLPGILQGLPGKAAEMALLEVAMVQASVLTPHASSLLNWLPKLPRLARVVALLMETIPLPADRLALWLQCVSLIPAPQLADWIRSTSLTAMPTELIQQAETLMALISFLSAQLRDPKQFSVAVEISEALCLALGPQNWAIVGGHLTQNIMACGQQRPEVLGFAATCLQGEGPLADLVMNTLMQLVNQSAMDDEYLQAACEAVQRVALKRFSRLIRYDLTTLLQQNIGQRLREPRTIAPILLKAMVRLHTSLLESTAQTDLEREWVDRHYLTHAGLLISSLFYAARHTLARSQLETAGRLLFELAQRYPSHLRGWLLQAVPVESFIKQIVGVKTLRRFKTIFVEFITSNPK